MIQIRKAALEDAGTIASLAEEIWTEHYTPIIGGEQVAYMLSTVQSYDTIRTELAQNTMLYYIIGYQGADAGYCGIQEKEDSIFLSKLYVKKECRRSGLSRKILTYIIQSFPYAESIFLTVNKNNHQTIAAYQKLGFVIETGLAKEIGGGFIMDDYRMRLRITADPGGRSKNGAS